MRKLYVDASFIKSTTKSNQAIYMTPCYLLENIPQLRNNSTHRKFFILTFLTVLQTLCVHEQAVRLKCEMECKLRNGDTEV